MASNVDVDSSTFFSEFYDKVKEDTINQIFELQNYAVAFLLYFYDLKSAKETVKLQSVS